MKWALVLLILLLACSVKQTQNGDIITYDVRQGNNIYTIHDIVYTMNGKEFRSVFNMDFVPAFDWIKENTPEDAVFLNWWDYGHMIQGYTGRRSLIYSPSEEILNTVSSGMWDTEGQGEFADHSLVSAIALSFTSENPETLLQTANEYGADYVLVTKEDSSKGYAFMMVRGLDPEEYYDNEFRPTEEAKKFILYQILKEEKINGMELAYADDFVKIYSILS